MASESMHAIIETNAAPHYSYRLWGFYSDQQIPLLAGDTFNFTIRVYRGNTFPVLLQSCPLESIPCHTFFQEGPDFLRSILSHSPYCYEFVEEIIEGIVVDVHQLFYIDDTVTGSPPPPPSLDYQPRNYHLLLGITLYDNDMRAAIEESLQSFRMIPASNEAIQTLSKKSMDVAKGEYCSICMEEFDASNECSTMPCDHVFHSQCIVTWLQTSHLCPLCRYALPTHTN